MTGVPPFGQRLGLAGLALGQERRGLSRMDLVGRQHVERRQPMDVVVPSVEAGEVGDGGRDVAEPAGIDGMRLDGPEVSFDARVVIWRAWPTEELRDAQLEEVLAGRVGAHGRAAIAEGLGPHLTR